MTTVKRMVEDVVGCKWSLSVIDLVKSGVNRPGEMARAIDGLTTKVLNERLRKLTRYGILAKNAYPEIPPRVEYNLTGFGQSFIGILNAIDQLETERQNPVDAPEESRR